MSNQPIFDNVERRVDLTRWNRANLSRFAYVDANAATLLEELKLALLGLYMRGANANDRTADAWRNLALINKNDRPKQDEISALLDRVDWQALHPDLPSDPVSRRQYNAALKAQYDADPGNPAWEIMRAFARAAHVLLGHLNAYANEGYLRTATQWDNLRRLAAMVNYQPGPPASAKSTVALLLDEDKGGTEVGEGLALQFSPPAGGPPLVFETLNAVNAHPALNAARLEDWAVNRTPMALNLEQDWGDNEAYLPKPGALGVISRRSGSGHTIRPVQVQSARRLNDAVTARIKLAPTPSGVWRKFKTQLHLDPDRMTTGLPRTDATGLVLKLDSADQFSVGAIVRISEANTRYRAVVLAAGGGYLKLKTNRRPVGEVTVEAFVPYKDINGVATTSPAVTKVYFRRISGSGGPTIRRNVDTVVGENEAHKFNRPAEAAGKAYAPSDDAPAHTATVVGPPPEVTPGTGVQSARTVAFSGKPPKRLEAGSMYAVRDPNGGLSARFVVGVLEAESQHFILFNQAVNSAAELTEFHGPMREGFTPKDHDRSERPAVSGALMRLAALPAEAADLIKPGRKLILEHDRSVNGVRFVEASVASRTVLANGQVLVTLETTADLSGWVRGGVTVHLNVVQIGQGETRTPKTLGSGDGEKDRQTFTFKIKDVSFAPSTLSLSGVEPALDIRVDGERWAYADHTDPAADGTRSWSYTFTEAGDLDIHFRRRLPTGNGNLVVNAYRVGVGAQGNDLTALAIDKPMKKHRFVSGILQPFPASGGADREAMDAIRENAPAQIVTNGRAVSLSDFEHLCRRHSSIAQARAERIFLPGVAARLRIVIIPQGGGLSDASLKNDLVDYLKPRSLPGVSVEIVDHTAVALTVAATLKVDLQRYDDAWVRERALAAMRGSFSLDTRTLGQPVYVAEVMAALAAVDGVDAALVTDFALKPGSPSLRRGEVDGDTSAFFPEPDQILLLDADRDLSLTLEALS